MTKTPTFLRRALAAMLATLFAVQPLVAISPKCAIVGWMNGPGACCCAEPASPAPDRARNCCAIAKGHARPEGVSVVATAKRCTCEANAPELPSALVRHDGARGESGSTHSLCSRIDRGAGISAATLVLSTASPPGEPGDRGAAPSGLRPFVPVEPAPSVAGGSRGLLAVTCVARC